MFHLLDAYLPNQILYSVYTSDKPWLTQHHLRPGVKHGQIKAQYHLHNKEMCFIMHQGLTPTALFWAVQEGGPSSSILRFLKLEVDLWSKLIYK